jgi:LysM repeat protein
MKRIFFLLVMFALWAAPALRGQDAATQERLDKLSGQIEDLISRQSALQKQLEALSKEVDNVRELASKPTGNYAAQEDLKRLADAVKEIDRKRLEDYANIKAALKDLAKGLSSPSTSKSHTPAPGPDTPPADNGKGYDYVVQQGDTLSTIAQAYREKNIKVTIDQIIKANPGLKPERLRLGQKIWIPAPQ